MIRQPRRKNNLNKKNHCFDLIFYRALFAVLLGVLGTGFLFFSSGKSAPLLANYFLANLDGSISQAQALAKYDVLILTPAQIKAKQSEVVEIRKKNPKIIILAYTPAQSYNIGHWPTDLIYKNLQVPSGSLMRDSSGNSVVWNDNLRMINMDKNWSDYYSNFIAQNIYNLPQVDGLFLDMVDSQISWMNNGNLDLNNDGVKDDKTWADKEWVNRMSYFLEKVRTTANPKYLVINGSSEARYQSLINGRMYENFPTPWEQGGDWARIMNGIKKNQTANQNPILYIFNSNTGNSGNNKNYQAMRFGLASSLLSDNVYYGFDYGDKYHGQLWWYDEYDVNLGTPNGAPTFIGGASESYKNGVWKREFSKGVAIINSGAQTQEIDLGAEYEKIIGTQDKIFNDGSVVSKLSLVSKDGILMLKTASQITNVPFGNGNFLRFYNAGGARARNGFFAFNEKFSGGAKIYFGDLDGKGGDELILVRGSKVEIFNIKGERWYFGYPFGGNFKGEINVAVGKLYGDASYQILLTPSIGGRTVLMNYHGGIITDGFFPLGEKYQGGFSGAIGNVDGSDFWGEVILGTNRGEVLIFDYTLGKLKKTIKMPLTKNYLVQVAAGNFDGVSEDKIATLLNSGQKISFWNFAGKKVSEFSVGSFLGSGSPFRIYGADVNFDGKDEIVVESGN